MAKTKNHVTKANVTVNEITQYLELQAKRRALLREADALSRVEAAVSSRLWSFAASNGGEVKKGKYVLSLVEVNGRPSWKNEFIRVAGEEAARDVVANLPTELKLNVTES